MEIKPDRSNIIARSILLLLLLAAAISLAACGGNDAPPDEAAVTAAEPTAATPAATEPDATAAPAEPTAEPTTAEPTEEPTALPPTAAPEEPAVASGECGHAYYPVVEGRALTYSTSTGEDEPTTYTTTYSNVTESSFTITTDIGEGEAVATDWQCSTEGLLSPEFIRLPGTTDEFQIEFTEASGFTIPSEDQFRVGESWPTHYVANFLMGGTDDASMTMIQTMDMTNTVTGTEPVSVPAGDFPNAVRVETVATISSTMDLGGGTTQPGLALDMNYISWYAEGVGLIRQEIPDFLAEGSEYITELVSIE